MPDPTSQHNNYKGKSKLFYPKAAAMEKEDSVSLDTKDTFAVGMSRWSDKFHG